VNSTNITNATAVGANAIVDSSNSMMFGSNQVTGWGFGVSSIFTTAAIQVGTNSTNGNGASLSKGGTWTNGSDRNKKENFTHVDGVELLRNIDELPVTRWNYKGENSGIRHIGPVAQDFYRIFRLGNDDKSISTIDPSGIALAAIKELSRENKELKASNKALQKRLEVLEKMMRSLATMASLK